MAKLNLTKKESTEQLSDKDNDSWKILVINDEQEVHTITRLALNNFRFTDRDIDVLSVYSVAGARSVLESERDIAVVLLDVVMEADDAGLRLVQYIREELKNPNIRIVLRTGQPGHALEEDIIIKYDINDYKAKTELTVQKLFATMVTALRTYDRMRTLDKLLAELAQRVLTLNAEVAAREQVEKDLRESESKLQRLSARYCLAREEESAAIAREVHDDLGGVLTVLRLGLFSILKKAENPQCVRDKTMSLLALSDSAMNSVKRISTTLRPPMLDTLGLVSAVRWYVNEFSKLAGIRHELHLPIYVRLSPDRATAVFRVIQEAMTNIARHAEATKMAIRMWKHENHLRIEIEDDGKGITTDALTKPDAFGIFGMHERIRCLSGELFIQQIESKGTTVCLRFPLETVSPHPKDVAEVC